MKVYKYGINPLSIKREDEIIPKEWMLIYTLFFKKESCDQAQIQ